MTIAGPAMGAGEQGHPIVGTWLITVDPESNPYDILMTVHPDGTLLLSQSTDDIAVECVSTSTRQGVWEKDGPRTLIGTHIGFMFYDPVTGECGDFSAYQLYRWWAEIRKDDPDTADAVLYVDL